MTRNRAIASLITMVAVSLALAVAAAPTLEDIMPRIRERMAEAPSTQSGPDVVARVIDGDTIELEGGERVRYIGIDTPESVKPGSAVECFAEEAARRNRELVLGKRVTLERDVSDRDWYGRLLRYVTLEDGTSVNETLVRGGYAYASSFPPDVANQDAFRAAERSAREEGRGLWSACRTSEKK